VFYPVSKALEGNKVLKITEGTTQGPNFPKETKMEADRRPLWSFLRRSKEPPYPFSYAVREAL